MKLIVNSDDFGFTRSVTYGILEAYRNGVVRSTTAMTISPHFELATGLAKEYPGLGVGIHLVLTAGKPLTQGQSLVNEAGKFYSLAENRFATYDLAEVEAELEAQIQKFLSTGLKPTHIDAHHNMQSIRQFTPIFVKLANKYNVPMRRLTRPYTNDDDFEDVSFIQERIKTVKHTQAINKDFYGEQATDAIFCQMLEKLVALGCETAESYSHPGFLEPELMALSSYNVQRIQELNVLTSPVVKAKIEELGIKLIHYGEL